MNQKNAERFESYAVVMILLLCVLWGFFRMLT